MTANPTAACYLRYQSRVCPRGRKPITLKVLDVEDISPHDIIVAVPSPVKKRRAMYMHLDRENGRVWLMRQDAELKYTSLDKIPIGINGEFITL